MTKQSPNERLIDMLFKPKKLRLRDLVGITLYGAGVMIMSPEWRKYNQILIADSIMQEAAAKAHRLAKAKAQADRDTGTKPVPGPTENPFRDRDPRMEDSIIMDSEARTEDHIPGRGGW